MAKKSIMHTVKKDNLVQQFCIEVPSDSLPALAPSSIRARTAVASLTANNLSYAKGGNFLHWWDTYPVPRDAPEPFNDSSVYGRVPAWGWAVILESNVNIAPGMTIWGYWPLSTLPLDLQLVPAPTPGHWIETSPHRQALMPYYNRYMIPKPNLRLESLSLSEVEKIGWTSLLRGQWESAYLLNHFVLSPDPKLVMTPSGKKASLAAAGSPDQQWSEGHGDLSSTVLINIAASSKTAKCFRYELGHNRPSGTGPSGVLSISSKLESDVKRSDNLATKSITYGDITDPQTLEWITSLKPKKALIVDFGGRKNSAGTVYDAIKTTLSPSDIRVIGLASEAKIPTEAEFEAQNAMVKRINWTQFNASGVKEAAMMEMGEEKYHKQMQESWVAWLSGGYEALGGVRLSWGEGIAGENGVEGGWRKIVEGKADPNVGMVYRL